MIFSRSKQIQPRKFSYQPRHSKEEKKERTFSFRDEEASFMGKQDQVAGSLRDLRYVKKPKNSPAQKMSKFTLILAIMGTIYIMYSDSFALSEAWGGELTKVMIGFVVMFIFIILFIKKSNSTR